jgi:putative transposase
LIKEKAFKYRIYPTKEQKDIFDKYFGCSRFVYNYYLRKRIDCYAIHKKGLSYNDNASDLVFLKKEKDWLKEVNSQCLQASLKDLETAYDRFFRGLTEFPVFKKKHKKQSFRVPQHFSVKDGYLIIPKVSPIRINLHRPLGDTPRSVTISRTPTGKYYASILCYAYIPDPVFEGHAIGIDLGVKSYLVDSNGKVVENPKFLERDLAKVKRLDQILAKKVKWSQNYKNLRNKRARLYEKISQRRSDFLHKLSLSIARENQTCYVETLSVKKMLEESNPSLARHIQDCGWSTFLTMLDYKGVWYGCKVVKIKKYFPSSKRCNCCGYINEELKLSDRDWVCPECGTQLDRDLNAAKNILDFGFAVGTTVKSSLQ